MYSDRSLWFLCAPSWINTYLQSVLQGSCVEVWWGLTYDTSCSQWHLPLLQHKPAVSILERLSYARTHTHNVQTLTYTLPKRVAIWSAQPECDQNKTNLARDSAVCVYTDCSLTHFSAVVCVGGRRCKGITCLLKELSGKCTHMHCKNDS